MRFARKSIYITYFQALRTTVGSFRIFDMRGQQRSTAVNTGKPASTNLVRHAPITSTFKIGVKAPVAFTVSTIPTAAANSTRFRGFSGVL
jgi:hypothetical protein